MCTAAVVRRARKRSESSGLGATSTSLIAPLDGAFALPQMADAAGTVARHLDLEMARPWHQALDVHLRIAKAARASDWHRR